MRNKPGSTPNFTNAAVVMFGVNITWIFLTIWAVWGLIAVAAAGWTVHHIINFIDKRRG